MEQEAAVQRSNAITREAQAAMKHASKLKAQVMSMGGGPQQMSDDHQLASMIRPPSYQSVRANKMGKQILISEKPPVESESRFTAAINRMKRMQ